VSNKIFVLIHGEGWDVTIGKVVAAFCCDSENKTELAACNAADHFIAQHGGKMDRERTPLAGWELVGVNFMDGGRTWRWRNPANGEVTNKFIAIRVFRGS
jgi:hypothetical protein